jgi:hypothetical protein
LKELRQFWEGTSSGVVGDKAIVAAWTALDTAAGRELPEGSGAVVRQRELSIGNNAADQRFKRDLGHVLGLMYDFKSAVQHEATGLAVGPARHLPKPRPPIIDEVVATLVARSWPNMEPSVAVAWFGWIIGAERGPRRTPGV